MELLLLLLVVFAALVIINLCGGVSNSWHLSTHNKASDIIVSGVSSSEVVRYCNILRDQGLIRYTYAIDGQAVHLDIGGVM